jgi:hypothetical protein
MSLEGLLREKFSRRLSKFEVAHEAMVFRGSQDPKDWKGIEENYRKERQKLINWFLNQIET